MQLIPQFPFISWQEYNFCHRGAHVSVEHRELSLNYILTCYRGCGVEVEERSQVDRVLSMGDKSQHCSAMSVTRKIKSRGILTSMSLRQCELAQDDNSKSLRNRHGHIMSNSEIARKWRYLSLIYPNISNLVNAAV